MKLAISLKAASDLQDITDFGLRTFGYKQTDMYLDGLFLVFDLIADNPEMGRRSDLASNVEIRQFLYKAHLIFYRVQDDTVKIAHIRSVRQSPPELADMSDKTPKE